MSRQDWYRRTTWTEVDREEFNARLKRSRGPGNKAQYLRIQALYLAEAGLHSPAIELLDRMFSEFPQRIELAQAHSQKADCLAQLGNIPDAVEEYREALQAEREFPNVRTQAWLDFGWFVMVHRLTHLYDEVSQVLEEFRDESGLQFPAIVYRYSAIRSLIADARRERTEACQLAKQALAEVAKEHSALRYHPTVGLVRSEHRIFENKLRELAGN